MRSQIYPGDGDHRHGMMNGYTNLGCRCDRCRATWAKYVSQRRATRASRIDPSDPRHGTESFYFNHSCRYLRCRTARTAGELARSRRRS